MHVFVYKIVNDSTNLLYFDSNFSNESIILPNISSGQAVPFIIRFELIDPDSSIVSIDEGLFFHIISFN